MPLLPEGGIDTSMRDEMLPCIPDVQYVPGNVKVCYETSFNRNFYKAQPMPPLQEIRPDILPLEQGDGGAARRDNRMMARPGCQRSMSGRQCQVNREERELCQISISS